MSKVPKYTKMRDTTTGGVYIWKQEILKRINFSSNFWTFPLQNWRFRGRSARFCTISHSHADEASSHDSPCTRTSLHTNTKSMHGPTPELVIRTRQGDLWMRFSFPQYLFPSFLFRTTSPSSPADEVPRRRKKKTKEEVIQDNDKASFSYLCCKGCHVPRTSFLYDMLMKWRTQRLFQRDLQDDMDGDIYVMMWWMSTWDEFRNGVY